MIKDNQKIFYKALGIALRKHRESQGFTVAMLAKESGEQNKTIRHIESGKPCSMHHLTWMSSILKIHNIQEAIYREIESDQESKEENIEKSNQESISSLYGLI